MAFSTGACEQPAPTAATAAVKPAAFRKDRRLNCSGGRSSGSRNSSSEMCTSSDTPGPSSQLFQYLGVFPEDMRIPFSNGTSNSRSMAGRVCWSRPTCLQCGGNSRTIPSSSPALGERGQGFGRGMALLASDTGADMRAVIEIGEIRQAVDPRPRNRLRSLLHIPHQVVIQRQRVVDLLN